MKLYQILLILLVIYLVGFLAHALYLGKTVYGDGIYYYAWLRSVVVGKDINFSDEYTRLGGSQPNTPLGTVGNKYAIGPALLWFPAFWQTHLLLQGDGYALPYQLSVGLTSVPLTLIGLLLLFRLLARVFDPTVSALTIVAIALTTNLLFYGSIDAVNSHSLSFFAAALFLSLVLEQRKSNWLHLGGALGLLGLIRPQDIIYGVLLLPLINFKATAWVFIGFVLVFLPQLVVWQLLYQRFWLSPYLAGEEGFRFDLFNLTGILFSQENGLFLWTPVVMAAFVGLFLLPSGRQLPKKLMITVVLLQMLIVASWSTWWQGASFSGRMFVSSLPILAFGVASVFARITWRAFTPLYFLLAIIGPLSVINAISIIGFLLKLR